MVNLESNCPLEKPLLYSSPEEMEKEFQEEGKEVIGETPLEEDQVNFIRAQELLDKAGGAGMLFNTLCELLNKAAQLAHKSAPKPF